MERREDRGPREREASRGAEVLMQKLEWGQDALSRALLQAPLSSRGFQRTVSASLTAGVGRPGAAPTPPQPSATDP